MIKKNTVTGAKTRSSMFELFLEFSKLKQLYRQGWLQNGINEDICESVAEHSFSTALTAWTIAMEFFPELDSNKVLQLAIVHDLGEIHTGDITPADSVNSAVKSDSELESVKQTFGRLSSGESVIRLWQEFEKEESPEAVFVKQIDKIEMIMQALVYEQSTGINLDSFKSSVKHIKNEKLKLMILEIIDEQKI